LLGFELTTDLPLTPANGGVTCAERRDGKTIGEIEIQPFPATLIIDRDGVLADKVREVACGAASHGMVHALAPVSLPGASGYRAEVEIVRGAALPYIYVFAMAPEDGGFDGGVLVIVRSACAEWPAAEQILRSMRLLDRRGVVHANDGDVPQLPVVGRRD
jgi:hypothetical protein